MGSMKKILGVFIIVACSLFFVPNNVDAQEMSAEFKSLLTENGKLKVNGAKPSSIEETYFLFEALYMSDEDNYLNYYWDNFSDDFSTVDFTINAGESNEETHTVGIEYVYDKDIKTMVDGYLSKIPENLEYFNVSDMEVINFWVNGKGDESNLINYSSELKKYLDYKNFNIDLRLGDSKKLITYTSGIANFIYNNTIYGVRDQTGVLARHVIYVDENTANTKEALISTVQKRIDNYIGKDKVKVTFGGESAYNLYAKEYDDAIASYEAELVTITQELETAMQNIDNICGPVWDDYDEECMNAVNAKAAVEVRKMNTEQELSKARSEKEYFLEGYNNEDGFYYFIHDAVNDYYFKAEVGEKTYYFIIAKDNDKIVESIIKTSDVKTDVTISTSNTQIPLDTTISAEQLTSGEEYNKIVKLLNLTDNLTFDLKLYSNSLDEYVTKLSDGSFEVKIPIPENFKGKDLIVYYVDSDNKVTEHAVTIEDGYAKFNTNHFSIYSLAEKNSNLSENKVTEQNPNTYDGIMTWITLSLISMSGIIGTLFYRKKQEIK